MHTVGLYFSQNRVYAATAGAKGKPDRWASEALDPESPGAAVASVLKQAGIAPKSVRLALSGGLSFVRLFEIPPLPKKERPEAVRFEAQKYSPFPIRELDFGYEIHPRKGSNVLEVTFAAARKEVVARFVQACERMGLSVDAVEPAAFASVRALASGDKGAEMIVLKHEGSVDTAVARDGLPVLARHSPLEEGAEAFRSEVRLAYDYFVKNFKSDPIKRLTLCLDAPAPDPCRALTEELGVPARMADTPPGADPAHLPGLMCAFGAALGAAQRPGPNLLAKAAVSSPLEFLNMPDLAPDEEARFLRKFAAAGAAAAVLAVAALFVFSALRIGGLKMEIGRLKSANAKLATFPLPPSPEELASLEQIVMGKSSFLEAVVGKRVDSTTKLNEIARALPDGVWLTRLEYEDDEAEGGEARRTLKIEGNILPRPGRNPVAVVNELAAALGNNAEFMTGLGGLRVVFIRNQSMDGLPVTQFSLDSKPRAGGA